MTRKLTAEEIHLCQTMIDILTFATKHPRIWHAIGPDEESRRAVELLAKRGAVEVREDSKQFRLALNDVP